MLQESSSLISILLEKYSAGIPFIFVNKVPAIPTKFNFLIVFLHFDSYKHPSTSLVQVSSCSNTGSKREDPYLTSRKKSLELIKLSNINKVSLGFFQK